MPAKLHILVLEDNLLDAELAIQALDQAGYTCRWECVDTRETFLARLGDHAYDLIISDYNMPTINGFSLVAFLKRNKTFCSIPLAILSGYIDETEKQRLLNAGVFKIFTKPDEITGYATIAKELYEIAKEQLD